MIILCKLETQWFTKWAACVFRAEWKKVYALTWQSQKLEQVVECKLTDNYDNTGSHWSSVHDEMSPVRVFKIRTANQILYIKCVTDRRALHDVVNSSITLTEKRLKIELFVMRESLEKEGSYSVAWVNS